jgi:hypothetical protein
VEPFIRKEKRKLTAENHEKGNHLNRILFFIPVIYSFWMLFGIPPAEAGVILPFGPPGFITVHNKSVRELRFANVQPQQFDFSCGSAAVATLMTYSFDRPTTEQEAFKYMYLHGDKNKIRKEGFSLLDIKSFLGSIGYLADGYRISLDRLQQVHLPAIALIQVHGYKHFVVIKGVTNRQVLIGDSAFGLRIESRKRFVRQWQGDLFFMVHSGKNLMFGRKTFNSPSEWTAAGVKGPTHLARIVPDVWTMILTEGGPNQFELGGFAKIGIP